MTALSVDAILAEARARAGTELFDSLSFMEGLEILVGDINRSRLVTDSGREGLRKIFTGLLWNRLRVSQWLEEHPETLDAPVPAPVIVIGAPRTGTTLVNHLLGADPARRAFRDAPPAIATRAGGSRAGR